MGCSEEYFRASMLLSRWMVDGRGWSSLTHLYRECVVIPSFEERRARITSATASRDAGGLPHSRMVGVDDARTCWSLCSTTRSNLFLRDKHAQTNLQPASPLLKPCSLCDTTTSTIPPTYHHRLRQREALHSRADTADSVPNMNQRRLSLPLSWLLLSIVTLLIPSTQAIKFQLPAYRFPPAKCVWNTVHNNVLVVVTANVGAGERQRVDVEIIDSSPQKNVYLSKKNINGETRLAVTTHAEGEVGVCFRNFLDHGELLAR